MPRKKKRKKLAYTHSVFGDLPLVPHPTKEHRLVAYSPTSSQPIYETDREENREWEEAEKAIEELRYREEDEGKEE